MLSKMIGRYFQFSTVDSNTYSPDRASNTPYLPLNSLNINPAAWNAGSPDSSTCFLGSDGMQIVAFVFAFNFRYHRKIV